jgi:hypothetical protein
VPDREAAARLATLRRACVDLDRRLRADPFTAPDSEGYWRTQIDALRTDVEAALERFPFHQRAIQQLPRAEAADDEPWSAAALREVAEVRARVDAGIERLGAPG